MSSNLPSTLKLWQEKMAVFEQELAITDSASKKFALGKQIEECRRKIQELEISAQDTELTESPSEESNSQVSTSNTSNVFNISGSTITNLSASGTINYAERKQEKGG